MLSQNTKDKLRQVMAHIKEEPRRLDMEHWGMKFDPSNPAGVQKFRRLTGFEEAEMPPCGTAACLAGTTYLLFTPKSEQNLIKYKYFNGININYLLGEEKYDSISAPEITEIPADCSLKAREILELTPAQANLLFDPIGWPSDFRWAYRHASMTTIPAERSAARYEITNKLVELFIDNDGDVINTRTAAKQAFPAEVSY